LIIAFSTTVLAVAIGTAAAYSMARFRTGGKHLAFWFLSQRMLPPVAIIIPVFLLYSRYTEDWIGISLVDTRLGLILLYTVFALPFTVWMMYAYFRQMPPELEEAALVDGCTRFGAFVRVVLPNAAPGLVATAVYAFLFAWDELLFASNLTQEHAETIPIGIRTFIGNYNQNYDQLMAAGVISTVPVMIAFFATQRWLVRGLTTGAVKQ
jgi:multiple sugar transport system permease protein